MLRRYIDGQEEHHKTKTFQDEYRAFLTKYGIEYDEQYVWDRGRIGSGILSYFFSTLALGGEAF